MPDMNENAETQQEYFGKVELKSKIVWQDAKDFGKVCTLTESALNGIINEATKELQEEIADLQLGISIRNEDMGRLQEQIKQSNERIKIMIDEKEKLEDANEKLWEREDEFKKDFETLLKKLMDRKVLKSWYYNGTFHYEFQEG